MPFWFDKSDCLPTFRARVYKSLVCILVQFADNDIYDQLAP